MRCGVECHGVILNALWYGYLRFSVQSSLLFLYYVVFSVMQFSTVYLSVGLSVHSVQCQSIASAQFYSVQCK